MAFSIYKKYFLKNRLFLKVIVFYLSVVKNVGKEQYEKK